MKTNHQLSRSQITDTSKQLWKAISEENQTQLLGGCACRPNFVRGKVHPN